MSAIAKRLSQVVVGEPVHFRNLTLYPLLADGPQQPDYRLLEAALADGSARVTEVSEAGSVPELCFVNHGDRPVLLLDGEELVGAKQNRILNLTILAPAAKTIVIPVSCVEAGRWHAVSGELSSARRAHFASGRARKTRDVSDSLRRRGSREADQNAVWHDIEEKARRLKAHSPTAAAAAIYAGHRETLDAFLAAFSPRPGQCGALFSIGGRVVGLDLFDSPATLAAALGKLVESYALDAIDADAAAAAKAPETPAPWIEAIAQADVERFAAVGEGEDWRLFGSGVSGAALVREGQVIHLCAFRVPAEDEPGGRGDPEKPNDFKLALATDRRLLRWRGQSQRHLHLRLNAPRSKGQRAPLDLALVLDRSGSMGGAKWARAREAALAAVKRLGPQDRVALVVFDDQIEVVMALTPAGAAAPQAAAQALASVMPRGRTNLGEGWLTGCELIGHTTAHDGRLRRCLLLTDGLANVGIVDPGELARHAAALRQLGVVTSTFGVGEDYDEERLGSLADAGGGAFHHIGSAEAIPALLGRELGDALEVVCRDVRVQLHWQAALEVEALGPWRVARQPNAMTLQVGDLVSEQELDLLVAVSFPPGAVDEDCAMQVQVSDGDEDLAEGTIRWTYVDSARRKQQPRNDDVEQRVAEHHAHQARFEAAAANRAGKLDQAREILMTAASWIRHYGRACPPALTLADALEGEAERHHRALSAREVKESFYETRNQIRGRDQSGARKKWATTRPDDTGTPSLAYLLPEDGPELAEHCRQAIRIPRAQAVGLGESALAAIEAGFYMDADGQRVDWREAVTAALSAKKSLPPDAALPPVDPPRFAITRVQVVNAPTLAVARRLHATHRRVLALNFANGVQPGGGFLEGNRGQESLLCRSSALFATLRGDPMYTAHAARPLPDSTDWAILSPAVPVFREDDGTTLPAPWTLGVLTCAAPYAPKLGVGVAAKLMESRIRRVLAIARAFEYDAFVLGAWGCGTYGNDPARIAAIFHTALREQAGAFAEVVFAVADWSPERQFLAPFAAELGRQP